MNPEFPSDRGSACKKDRQTCQGPFDKGRGTAYNAPQNSTGHEGRAWDDERRHVGFEADDDHCQQRTLLMGSSQGPP